MQEYFPPKGLIVDLITPADKDFSFAKEDFSDHLNRLKKHVDAIMILSPEAGEGFDINIENKKEILGICLEVIKEELSIFVSITGNTEDETMENILEFNKLLSGLSYKGKIFWVDAPLYYHSNRGLPDMCKKLSSVTPHPLILYNNPRIIDKVKGPFNRRNIRTSVLKELSLIEEVVGLIYIGDLRRALNYQNAVRIRSNFRIYDADEELFLNFPNKSGLVSISANLIPHIWKQMLDLYSETEIRTILRSKSTGRSRLQIFSFGENHVILIARLCGAI